MQLLTVALIVLLAALSQAKGPNLNRLCPPGQHRIEKLEYFQGDVLPCMYAGPLRVGVNATLFYWFARQSDLGTDKPLVLWMQGGPGSSSSLGNFAMHGPVKIERTGAGDDDFRVSKRDVSWAGIANVIYLDQPVGTGFSFGTPVNDLKQSSVHFVNFMIKFIALYPEFQNSPFFITGESYGGKYIPSYTWAVMQHNKKTGSNRINLKGMMVGDPFSSPLRQRTAMHVVPYALNILDSQDMNQVDSLERICEESLFKTNYVESEDACGKIIGFISSVSGNVLPYDTRSFSSDWDPIETAIEEYFTKSARSRKVQDQVHMAFSPKNPPFEMSSSAVGKALSLDNLIDYTRVYESILEEADFPVLVYAGEFDAKDGPNGQETWLRALRFKGSKEFWDQDRKIYFLPNGGVGGYFRAVPDKTRFQILTVPKAGHFVPANNIKVTLSVLLDFFHSGGLTCHQEKTPFCSTRNIRCSAMKDCSGHGVCQENGQCLCNDGWAGGACDMNVIVAKDTQQLHSTGPKWWLLSASSKAQIRLESDLPFDLYISRGSGTAPSRFDHDIAFRKQERPLTLDPHSLGLDSPNFLILIYVRGISHRDNDLLENNLRISAILSDKQQLLMVET